MAASGEIPWPPMGSFPWPPSHDLIPLETLSRVALARVIAVVLRLHRLHHPGGLAIVGWVARPAFLSDGASARGAHTLRWSVTTVDADVVPDTTVNRYRPAVRWR